MKWSAPFERMVLVIISFIFGALLFSTFGDNYATCSEEVVSPDSAAQITQPGSSIIVPNPIVPSPVPMPPEDNGNSKDMSEFWDGEEAFLISDREWQDAFSLVPVTIWTEHSAQGGIIKHPTLIYHVETVDREVRFDADSIIHFLEQYQTQRVTLVNETPAELVTLLTKKGYNINKIVAEDFSAYWESIGTVVIADVNDYKAGMLASVFASYINAPLYFPNTTLAIVVGEDPYEDLRGKNVMIVGSLASFGAEIRDYIKTHATTFEEYSLERTQKKYLELTNTGKIILVNPLDMKPHDILIQNSISFIPDLPEMPDDIKETKRLSNIYNKTSMAAPILAAAKHELILLTAVEKSPFDRNADNFPELLRHIDTVDAAVEYSLISGLLKNNQPDFLTIMSDPISIAQDFNCSSDPREALYRAKNATDSIYSSFPQLDPQFFDVVVDNDGTPHILAIMKTENFAVLHHLVWDSASMAWQDTELYKGQFLPDGLHWLRAAIDSEGNIHIVFRGVGFQYRKLGIQYLKIAQNNSVLIRKTVVESKDEPEERAEQPNIAVDNNCMAHITYQIYSPSERLDNSTDVGVVRRYYLKLNQFGAIEINKEVFSTVYEWVAQPAAEISTDRDNNAHLLGAFRAYSLNGYCYSVQENTIDAFGNIKYNPQFQKITFKTYDQGFLYPFIKYYRTEPIYYVCKYDPDTGKSELIIKKENLADLIKIPINSFAESGINNILNIIDVEIDEIGNAHMLFAVNGGGKTAYLMIDVDNKPVSGLGLISAKSVNAYSQNFPKLCSGTGCFAAFTEDKTFNEKSESFLREFGNGDYEIQFPASGYPNKTLHTGRIYGLTLSDTTSHINRTIFYDDNDGIFSKLGELHKGMTISAWDDEKKEYIYLKLKAAAERAEYDEWLHFHSEKPEAGVYKDKQIISYDGHGGTDTWCGFLSVCGNPSQYPDKEIPAVPELNNLPFVPACACATAYFDLKDLIDIKNRGNTPTVIGSAMLRKGAGAYYGTVTSLGISAYDEGLGVVPVPFLAIKYLTDPYGENVSTGKVNTLLINEIPGFGQKFVMYGDPTFVPNVLKIELSDFSPPKISAVAAYGMETTATITWMTNEDVTSVVSYGTDTTYGSEKTDSSSGNSHSILLDNLTVNTTYHFKITCTDNAGNKAETEDYTFTTKDVTHPTITDVAAKEVTATTATITWKTDEPATSAVYYNIGGSPSYENSKSDPDLVIDHSITLDGLQ
ncbi:MAG: fibronectin type III domain-containing protein, partial [Candidatus Omnitrophota bacterium]